MEKLVFHFEFDFKNELRNVCVKNTLLQAIKTYPSMQKLLGSYVSKNLEKREKSPYSQSCWTIS